MLKQFLKSVLKYGLRPVFAPIERQVQELQSSIHKLEDEMALLRLKASAQCGNIPSFWANRQPDAPFIADEVFILGSGPSMLQLTSAERARISNAQSIAMNRYLLFWDLIGIWPNFVYLADSLGIGKKIFLELSQLVLHEDQPKPVFLLEEYFREVVHPDIPAVIFKRDDRQGTQLTWASSLENPLFFHRGSLTSLINLTCMLRIAPVIKLVGIDLGKGGSFYRDAQATRYPTLINEWDEKALQLGAHATVAHVNGWNSSMLDHWPDLANAVRNHGCKLYCCNPQSLLVSSGLCEYRDVCT